MLTFAHIEIDESMDTEKIKSYIETIISLTDEDWEILSTHIEYKILKKNEYLLHEGVICNFIAFINKGVLIYCKELENGNGMTTDMAFEGEWVTDNYSRLKRLPSHLNIKAIEDCELWIIKEKDLPYLYQKIPSLERFGRILTEQAFIKMTQMSIDLQTLSAKERYLKLFRNYPEIFQRIPLHYIANYLGIAPKSLSRIRNTIFKKE